VEPTLPRSEACPNFILLVEHVPHYYSSCASFRIIGLQSSTLLGEFPSHAMWCIFADFELATCRRSVLRVSCWDLVLVRLVCLVTMDERI
jgi:hypothetical protein